MNWSAYFADLKVVYASLINYMSKLRKNLRFSNKNKWITVLDIRVLKLVHIREITVGVVGKINPKIKISYIAITVYTEFI